jgi:dihydropteroate synthase
MGIVNATPDSFSDGGRYLDPQAAIDHALELLSEGADLIDIGGESTRPGCDPVTPAQERARVVPVIAGLRKRGVTAPLSIDTYHVEVAEAAVKAGANLINDLSGFRDPAMVKLAVRSGAACVVMHMAGEPRTMQHNPVYEDVTREVSDYLLTQAAVLEDAGVAPDKIILDPGFGFGKTHAHNLILLAGFCRDGCPHPSAQVPSTERTDVGIRPYKCTETAPAVCADYPVLIGISRKTFIGTLLGIEDPLDRDAASAQLAADLAARGATYLRVHNVKETKAALTALTNAPTTAYVALGSNSGDKLANLRHAVDLLREIPLTTMDALAPPVVSKAAYETDQADFINTVCRLTTHLGVYALFAELQAIEHTMGRVKTKVNGPRTIDLDLLTYGDMCHSTPALTLPHPRITERPFVFEPLRAIAPDFRLPGTTDPFKTSQDLYGHVIQRLPAL